MVWTAFSARSGKAPMVFVSNKIDSKAYQEMLVKNLLPYLRKFRSAKLLYQQDNAPVHVSASTLAWFEANKVNLLDWPPCSPDINVIENVWSLIVRRVYANSKQYRAVDELKKAIVRAWEEIDLKVLGELVNSVPKRLIQTIERHGKMTDY